MVNPIQAIAIVRICFDKSKAKYVASRSQDREVSASGEVGGVLDISYLAFNLREKLETTLEQKRNSLTQKSTLQVTIVILVIAGISLLVQMLVAIQSLIAWLVV